MFERMEGSLLVLGGSAFVGRALVSEAVARDWEVTTFNRGTSSWTLPGVEALHGDRLAPHGLAQLRGREWDLVVDTWSAAPRVVRDSARALRDHAGRYAYISSGSVYTPTPPRGALESAETVAADPAWWLARMARGGEILCPGPADLGIQYVDARDLAGFVIEASSAGHSGPFNVVSRQGHATMGSLLRAYHCAAGATDGVLTWIDPQTIAAAGIEPWSELPIWIPPGHEYSGMHDANVDRAYRAGLQCRPVTDTVLDTWRWFSALNTAPPVRAGLPTPGLDTDRERQALAAWHEANS
jgi:2'-hydroxyisoflavone reductase